jgi:hypothetical protein
LAATRTFHLQTEHIWQLWAGSLAMNGPNFLTGF